MDVVNKFVENLKQCVNPSRKSFSILSDRVKARKINSATKLFDELADVISPGESLSIMDGICKKKFGEIKKENNELTETLKTFSQAYLEEDDKFYRLHYLSFMSNLVPYSKIQDYLPGITYYNYKKSTELAISPKTIIEKKPKIITRWTQENVDYFVEFITSPTVITELPFGKRTVKIANNKIDIPNVLRKMKNSEIIKLYKQKLENENNLGRSLSDSTMYRILDRCTASLSRSMTCVDYFLVDAHEVSYYMKRHLLNHNLMQFKLLSSLLLLLSLLLSSS